MKKAICAACTAAVLLCSCGGSSMPDPAKDHKEFLNYTFGGDYSIEKDTSNDDDSELVWNVSFTDKSGSRVTDKLRMTYFEDSEAMRRECDWSVLNFVVAQENVAMLDELYNNLISKNFDCVPVEDSIWTLRAAGRYNRGRPRPADGCVLCRL